jgi:predicted metal-dependent enzyme (double-stranded beta helix superfamily)
MGSMEPVPGLTRFFETAEALVADHGPSPEVFARIGALLRPLAADPVLLHPSRLAALHDSSAGFTILGYGPGGSTLMLARFPGDAPTPVHNHNSWGVLCVIRGRDRHILWAREDDGAQPGRARLRTVESRELGPGEWLWFPDAPGDIHSQQGIGGDAWELVYFARDPTTRSRLYFDPQRELVEERAPAATPR